MSKPRKDKDGNYPVRMVLAVEGVETSDGRTIQPEALDHRTLPLSVMGLTETSQGGHLGAKVTGRLDRVERVDGSRVKRHSDAEGGTFDEGTHVWLGYGVLFPGTEATDRWLQGGLRGNSVDLTAAEAELTAAPEMANDAPGEGDERKLPTPPKVTFTKATIAATTLCPVPAFEDAYVEADLGDEWGIVAPETGHEGDAESLAASGMRLASYRAPEVGDWCSPCEAGELEGDVFVAAAPPALGPDDAPPLAAFTDPKLKRLTRLTVTETGEVIGHVADWRGCHTSYGDRCTPPPRSRTDYAVFHGGSIRARDEQGAPRRVAVGQLTIGGGHAPDGDLRAALDHYDNVSTVWADVVAGEDRFGVWVHGVLRPGVTADQLRAIEGARVSGDWRRFQGNLELMGVHCVNLAGFPILAEHYDGEGARALVAAGAPADPVQVQAPTADTATGQAIDYDRLADLVAARVTEAFDRNPWKDGNKAGTKGSDGGAEHRCGQPGCGNKATKTVLPKGDGAPRYACDEHAEAMAGQSGTVKSLADDSSPPPDLAGRRSRALLGARRHAALQAVGASPHVDAWTGADEELAQAFADQGFVDWFEAVDTDLAGYLDQLDALDAADRELFAHIGTAGFNWVSDVGGLPKLIKRVSKHLRAKGMTESHAIATAVNVVKRYCKNRDLNFPGKQNIKAKTIASGCAAVAEWEAKKARARAS